MDARTRPTRSDLLIALGVLLLAVLEVSSNHRLQPKVPAAAFEFAVAVVLVWRRQAALLVILAVALLSTGEAVAGVPLAEPLVPLVGLLLALYAVGGQRWGTALAGLAVAVSADALQVLVQHKGIGNFLFGLIFMVGTWAVARIVRARTRENVALQAQAEHLAEDRDLRDREAAALERSRIARELHDVISHSVSVMVVQAGAAEQTVLRDPARAAQAMQTVQETGRQALGELAHLLGIMRHGGEEIGLAPQPGIGDLSQLITQAQADGMSVELRVEGCEHELAAGVQLSVFRVIQEALTNVRKHADPEQTRVVLRYLTNAVEAEITNDDQHREQPRRRAPADLGGLTAGGHGLIGMRERVAIYGGTLTTDAAPGGGYVVRARIPLSGSDSS